MRPRISTPWVALLLCLPLGLPAAGAQDPKEPGDKEGKPAAAEASEPPGKVSVEVKPPEARLADPIELTIRVEDPGGQRSYELPDKLPLQDLEELSRDRQEQEVGGKKLLILGVKVAAYEKTGEITIPEFALVGKGPNGELPPPVSVPELKVKIRSLLQGLEKPQPRDIASPEKVRVRDLRLLVALGLIALWLLFALLLRLHKGAPVVPERKKELPPPRLAHEIALEKLTGVVEENLLRQGKVQEFFFRISEAVREYVGNRYGFYALDLTTRELLEELRDRHTPGLEHGELGRLLHDADLVKFARLNPTDDVCSKAINGAFALVEATRFKEEVKEPA